MAKVTTMRNAPSFFLDSYLQLFLCRVRSSENSRETLIQTSTPCLAYSLEIDSLLPRWYVCSSSSTCMYSQKCRNFGLFSFFIIYLYWGATFSLSFSLLFYFQLFLCMTILSHQNTLREFPTLCRLVSESHESIWLLHSKQIIVCRRIVYVLMHLRWPNWAMRD